MKLSASMMCAGFDNLKKEVCLLNDAGIDSFHIDIMDGMFVPNLGMGLQDMECISRNTDRAIEAHLMVCNIEPYLKILHKCKVNTAYIHPEADYHPFSTLQKIEELEMEPGLAVDPGASVECIEELLNVVNKVLIMAVNPGGAGRAFLPYIEEKVRKLIRLKEKYDFQLFWDGACTEERLRKFAPMGVDGFVLGTGLLFGHQESYGELIRRARNMEFEEGKR
ncbi:MAG: ribulose-phosphate 3-epimerase [Lachnospiraceae bacterium]|nr:ribulose-phosphate 3-epimerase [Lachnospiraceae bacterium]